MTLPPGYSLRTARTPVEVDALRPFWKKVCPHPFCDPDTFLSIVNVRDDVIRPHVIILEKEGAPLALVAGRIERHRVDLAVGYSILARPTVRALTILHPGVMGARSAENAAALFSGITEALDSGDAEAAFLSQQGIDSDLFRTALSHTPLIRRNAWPKLSLHWTGTLGGDFEDFLKARSSNTRGNLRRYSKRIEKEFPGDRIEVRSYRDISGLDSLLSDTEAVEKTTYHRHMTNGWRDRKEKQALFRTGMEHGWLRAFVLTVNKIPAAYWYVNVYRRTLFISSTGFDPALSSQRPGTYLLVRMLREICARGEADRIDFGWGDAQYKSTLGDTVRAEASLYIFPATLRGISLALLKSGTNGLTFTAGYVLHKLRTWKSVRKVWRNRLMKK